MTIYLLIDSGNIAYHLATTLNNFNADDDVNMADALLLFVHRRHWLTSNFPVIPIWCCDHRPYWRTDIEPEYKATRDHTTKLNVALVLKRMRVLNFPILDLEGFEADDWAAAVVKRAEYEHVYLLTTDSDWMGLVGDKVTCISPSFNPRLRSPLEAWAWLRRKHAALNARNRRLYEMPPPNGFDPREIWRFKSITGDTGDNLPPGTPLCLIDLFEPFTAIPDADFEKQFNSINLEAMAWDPVGAQEFNQELPDQPFNPVRIMARYG